MAPRIHEGKRLEVAAETPLPLRRNLPSLPFVNTRWLRPSCDLNLLPSRSGAGKIAVDSRSQPPPRAHMEFPRFLWIDSGAKGRAIDGDSFLADNSHRHPDARPGAAR